VEIFSIATPGPTKANLMPNRNRLLIRLTC
jgi:hypothetical protein